MYILYLYSLRNIQIHMCKVPNSTAMAPEVTSTTSFPWLLISQSSLTSFSSAGLGNRQYCNIYVILPDKRFQLLHGHNLHTTDILPHKLRIRIEHSLKNKTTTLKVQIITQGSAQVTGSDNNEIMLLIQP